MRRIKLGIVAAAVTALAAVGLLVAPSAEAANIGTPPGTILKLCITLRPQPPILCVYL